MFKRTVAIALALTLALCGLAAAAEEKLPDFMIPSAVVYHFNDFMKMVMDDAITDEAVRKEVVDFCQLEFSEIVDQIIYYDNYDHSVELSFYYEEEAFSDVESPHSMTFVISNEVSDDLEYLLRSIFVHTVHSAEQIETTLGDMTTRERPSENYMTFTLDSHIFLYAKMQDCEVFSLIAGDGE